MLNKVRGIYYTRKSSTKRKIAYLGKKLTATRNAVTPIWFPSPQSQQPKIDPAKRVERFFGFCRDIEEHPYFLAHNKVGTITQKSSFDMENDDHSELNVDEVHLESLLTRIRQFLFDGELYFFDDLADSIRRIFDSDPDFEDFCKKLKAILEKPFPKTNFQAFLPNGEDAIAGRTIYELIEMELYTGRIHSEHTANPRSRYYPLANANVAVRKVVTFHLSCSSIKVAGNILYLRNHVLRLARNDKKVDLFPALANFDVVARNAGH
jgi:hypothetical protein